MLQQNRLIYFVFATLLLLGACKKNIPDPEFVEGDSPRIFQLGDNFRTSYILNEGESANWSGLLFSPAGKVNISWKVDGVVASTDTIFNFKPTAGGEYKIELEAEYKGLKSVRTATVLVNPSSYTPVPYTKVAMAYLSETGLPANVNWDYVTHVAYQTGKVSSDGNLDITTGEINQRMDELVARGHIKGKPVLLSIAGRLSGIDGWALYDSRDFGEAIRDVAKRAGLVTAIKNYLALKKIDGVDIIMTDINGDPNYTGNLSALGSFVTSLRAALPAGALITCAVTTGWQHWDYPDLSAVDWVNVHAFEDGIHVGPGAPVGQASTFDYMVSSAEIWKNFHVGADKIVIGMPAFGLRYTALDASGNNLSWGSYDYISYQGILALDPAADTKETINSAEGIYYNGVPLITKKAAYIKSSAYKGAYLWTIDYDSPLAGKSLTQALYNGLK
ncbi:MAG: glycosyl hydrolase family 18 protein [Ferruginibacter sp.]